MNRIFALVWGAAGLFIGYLAVSVAIGPKGDASGWVLAGFFAAVAVFCFWQLWRDWNETRASRPAAPSPVRSPQAAALVDFPGAWRGPRIPLETQIAALADAGLAMAPGRTTDELLTSWSRAEYECDPYGLLLFMYGSEVEAEPSGRYFFERGWNFDMECLNGAGDYVRAFKDIVRIAGQPHLVTQMSDNFDPGAETVTIRYTIKGQARVLSARVNNDWADPVAVAAFVRDLEAAIGNGRRFWAADNGQASVLFFLNAAEAGRVNALRTNAIVPYLGG